MLQASPSRTPSLPEDLRGSVQLTLTYDPAAGILTVRLIEVILLNTVPFTSFTICTYFIRMFTAYLCAYLLASLFVHISSGCSLLTYVPIYFVPSSSCKGPFINYLRVPRGRGVGKISTYSYFGRVSNPFLRNIFRRYFILKKTTSLV